jgi:hypothetical protein
MGLVYLQVFFFFIGACLYWEIYRKQRNLVNKIKKQSIRNYFIERCAGGPSEIILLKDVQVVLKVNISGLQ